MLVPYPGTTTLFARLLAEMPVLVADGGLGTSLFRLGMAPGACPELLNVDCPELVMEAHGGFLEAGSDIVLTNTFGANRRRLALHRLEDRVAELNLAAVGLVSRLAARFDRPIVVAGSVGPTGDLLAPLGNLEHRTAVEVFAEQIDALVSSGVDVIWIETLSATEELAAAVEAARLVDLPVVTTMSFDSHGSTMMGVPPTALAEWWTSSETVPAAVGANCGVGPADVVVAASEIHAQNPGLVVVAKGNCGIPQLVDGTLWYPTSTDDMTAYAELAIDAGVRIIGACCGSVPAHIEQIRKAVHRYATERPFDLDEVARRLGSTAQSRTKAKRERRGRRRVSA